VLDEGTVEVVSVVVGAAIGTSVGSAVAASVASSAGAAGGAGGAGGAGSASSSASSGSSGSGNSSPQGDPLSLLFVVQYLHITSRMNTMPPSFIAFAGPFGWANLQMSA